MLAKLCTAVRELRASRATAVQNKLGVPALNAFTYAQSQLPVQLQHRLVAPSNVAHIIAVSAVSPSTVRASTPTGQPRAPQAHAPPPRVCPPPPAAAQVPRAGSLPDEPHLGQLFKQSKTLISYA